MVLRGTFKCMLDHTDEQLIANYLSGDEQSLELLVKHFLKPIYGFVYRYIGSVQEAEDATQDVFIKVWRNFKKFDRQKSFKTWIFSIAKNTAIDYLKKKKNVPFSFLLNDGENNLTLTLADPAPLSSELFDRQNLRDTLAKAMDKLALPYRMVLFLRYNDHFNFREIAESLDEPLNTVKSRHRRAMIMLKNLLDKKEL